MEQFIALLREFSLRKQIGWGMLLLFIISVVLVFGGHIKATTLLLVVYTVWLYMSFAAYAIDKKEVVIFICYMLMAGGSISAIAGIRSFSNMPDLETSFMNDLFFGQNNLEEWVNSAIIESSLYSLISNILYCGVFIYGFKYVKSKYMFPWIVLVIGCALEVFVIGKVYFSKDISTYNAFTNINTAMGALLIITLLIIGGDPQGERVVKGPAVYHPAPKQQQATTANAHSSMAQKLIQLKALLDSGVLTQEEFDAEKKKILNN